MNLSNLWAISIAEIRTSRRLVRTWVIIAIASIVCVGQWLMLSATHSFMSGTSPAVGLTTPLFQFGNLTGNVLGWLTLGMFLLAFDIRFRDIRDRIDDAVCSRSFSNFELVAGRLLGLVTLLGSAAAILLLVIFAIAAITSAVGAPVQGPITVESLCAFLVWDIVPNLMLWGALTIFLSVVVRSRVVVVLILVALGGAYMFIQTRLPYFLNAVLSMSAGVNVHPSAVIPQFVSSDILLNRGTAVVLSIGLLALAAVAYPRRAPPKSSRNVAIAGATALATGVFGVFGLYYSVQKDQQQFETWTSVHAEHQEHRYTDIERISGSVAISPGRRIDLDLVLSLRTRGDLAHDAWLIALNPGYKIRTISIGGTEVEGYTFENGLLRIPRTGPIADSADVHLKADGVPNSKFAYLDTTLNWWQADYLQVQQLNTLGRESYVFHPRYVALLPGVSWFPSAGAAYGKNVWDPHPADFFNLDIVVSVPRGWTIAGPGSRELVEEEPQAKYRFNPKNPIPEFALIGSKFERRAITVGGMDFELLLSSAHSKTLDSFLDVGPLLKEWIVEKMANMLLSDLMYPFGTLSLVEVPVSLRIYGGGWRMDSISGLPGIQLLRESGFPTARFDNSLQAIDGTGAQGEEEVAKGQFAKLREYFAQDPYGGNPMDNFSLNLINFQTMPTGTGSIGIKYVLNEIATNLTTDTTRYFSVMMGSMSNPQSGGIGGAIQMGIMLEMAGQGGSYGETMRGLATASKAVWELAARESLSSVDYQGNPTRGYHLLLLKGNAIADTIIDDASAEIAGSFLRELVDRFRGRSYTKEELAKTAEDVGLNLDALAGDWLEGSELPGFLAVNPKTERLKNTESGESVYQTSFILRNNEPVPGRVELSYTPISFGDERETQRSLDSIHVPGSTSLQVAFQSESPTAHISVAPLLSLNRGAIELDVPYLQDRIQTDAPELPPVAEVDWLPPYAGSIVVDDLDDGFSIENQESNEKTKAPWILEIALGQVRPFVEDQIDQGLPPAGTPDFMLDQKYPWKRTERRYSFGLYRNTHAIKEDLSSNALAQFRTTLPNSGTWRLDYHIPGSLSPSLDRIQGRATDSDEVNETRVMMFGSQPASANNPPTDCNDFYTPTSKNQAPEEEAQTKKAICIEIRYGQVVKPIELDLSTAVAGWNDIGQFDLTNSEVDVVIYGAVGESEFAVADAIKWTKISDAP